MKKIWNWLFRKQFREGIELGMKMQKKLKKKHKKKIPGMVSYNRKTKLYSVNGFDNLKETKDGKICK